MAKKTEVWRSSSQVIERDAGGKLIGKIRTVTMEYIGPEKVREIGKAALEMPKEEFEAVKKQMALHAGSAASGFYRKDSL